MLYGVTVVNTAGICIDGHWGRESETKLFQTEDAALEYGAAVYRQLVDAAEDAVENGIATNEECKGELNADGYCLIQFPDFHIQIEMFGCEVD